MSSAPHVKRPWPVLVQRAQATLQAAQTELSTAQQRHEQLSATQQRLQGMLHEYQQRQQQQLREGVLMGDQLNTQRFLVQLQQLLQHAERETRHSAVMLERRRQAVVQAQRELDKMEKLDEQDKVRQQKAEDKREGRRLDEMAVMRFRFRES